MTECARHRPLSCWHRLGAALEQQWGSHYCALLSPLLSFSSPTLPAAGLGDSVLFHHTRNGFQDGPVVKETSSNAGDPGSIPSQEHPLEEEMASHSSILVWRIPCTEETGRLQLIRSHGVDMRRRGHSAHHTIQMDIFHKQLDIS